MTANSIGFEKSNAGNWAPDGATNMPYKCFVNPTTIAVINACLSEHSAQLLHNVQQSSSSGFTAVAAETPLHSWSQCWSCWSGFEMVQLWLILWIPLALHRQVVLTQIELQSLEGKEEEEGQTMRVGCRKKRRVLSFITRDI